jgi:hypothetical protein
MAPSSIKRRSGVRKGRFAAFVALAMLAAGCELIVDFDRTKIDGGGGDGSLPDVTTQDVTQDVPTQDVVNDTTNDVTQQPDASDGGGDASDGGTGMDAADADDGATE